MLLAFFYAAIALLTWPVRQLWRIVRGRTAYRKAKVKRVVIVGFDGMDPKLAAKFMAEGKLPNLASLRDQGTFQSLATTNPPISPVAWSTFLTGSNPGKHNIYDFLARDTQTYLPFLSSAQIRGPKRTLRFGKYEIPIGKPQIRALRRGKPFWHYLGEQGVFSSVIRVPITFPPEKFPGVLLSGMCVPDLRGTQGTFSFHTMAKNGKPPAEGGVQIPFTKTGETFHSYLPGPDNPIQKGKDSEIRLPFALRPSGNGHGATLEIRGKKIPLRIGEYSPWEEVEFSAGLGGTVHGICRFYLKKTLPEPELYVTPININPKKPALPISHPLTYSIYLAKLHGPYATLGLAEDTWALNEDAIPDEAFLEQCYTHHSEREKMFFDALDKTPRGVCVCVFDTTDRVQHMFWRYMEQGHPATAGKQADSKKQRVIEELYQKMDELVGRTMKQLSADSVLLVLSDHGFQSFARGFNLNGWLRVNGYLALKEGADGSGEWFKDVDWAKTRAYGMGLNGLYLNLKGRERSGTVNPGAEGDALIKELCEKIRGLVDTGTSKVAIRETYPSQEAYKGPFSENAPDILIGYAEGARASWETVMGKVTPEIFVDNCRAWSGDHCVDPHLVPGVLFSNQKIAAHDPAIVDVAPTVLELFGVKVPSHFDGKAWTIGSL
ncbi:MAG: alkaline phosphatase family protein [Acidobacteria bacterium]|nr:alkaline phosphatase family protein [Acidobacteriota bacterium]